MSLSALLFLAVFAAACVMALARHPIYGVMGYVLVLYVSPVDRWWGYGYVGEVRWSLIAAIVSVLSILIHKVSGPPVSIFRQSMFRGYLMFVAWIAVMSFWALSTDWHVDVLEVYVKYIIAMVLIYKTVDSERNLQLILWAHVVGCAYISWIAYTTFTGGRFNDFGGAGIGDANASALTIVTGILAGASLFLLSKTRERILLLVLMPLLVNAVVATVSRSAFLAFACGGLVFYLFSPKRFRAGVIATGVAGLVLFFMLANPEYWGRIGTIKYMGEEVQQVDTGSKRLVLIQAQLKMYRSHLMGCGSRCTDVLSPRYLSAEQLAGRPGELKARSSHNTFMTALVEYGTPGGVFYLLMIGWVVFASRRIHAAVADSAGSLPFILPGVAGGLAAIIVSDMFVQYPKLEVRFWLLTLLMVMVAMTAALKQSPPSQGWTAPVR